MASEGPFRGLTTLEAPSGSQLTMQLSHLELFPSRVGQNQPATFTTFYHTTLFLPFHSFSQKENRQPPPAS